MKTLKTKRLLEFINLSKRYSTFYLDDCSLSLSSGTIMGLVGQNGAGKSTLVKCALGFVAKDAGQVLLDGDSVEAESILRQEIGYIPEDLTFYEWMTVSRHLAFVASFYPRWDHAYCKDLVKRMDLDSSKLIKHLSKGMRAKLALIAALSARPAFLVLDEPTSGLDPLMKDELLNELAILVQTREVEGILISSHLLSEIAQLCNYIAVIRKGCISYSGTTNEVTQGWKKVTIRAGTQLSVSCKRRIRSDGTSVVLIGPEKNGSFREMFVPADVLEFSEPSLEEVLLEVV